MILYILITFITVIFAYIYGEVARRQNAASCVTAGRKNVASCVAAGRETSAGKDGLIGGKTPGCITHTRGEAICGMCLITVFLILFMLSAFRLNVGNDYATYVEFMHRLYTAKYIADPGVPTEWGFNLLSQAVYILSGFENYILVFAIYAAVTIALFISALRNLSFDFTAGFFMFMTLGYYFQSFSTVRYYLGLAIALYSMKFVLERRWLAFAALIILGSGFHKSLLVVLLLYPIASVAWKRWQLLILAAFSTTGLFLKDFYMKIFIRLYPSYEDTEYLAGSGISWINVFRCLVVLGLAGYYVLTHTERKRKTHDPDADDRTKSCSENRTCHLPGEDPAWRFYLYLNIGALLLYLFWGFLPVVSRIGYYLTVSQLVFVPKLIYDIENERLRKIAKYALVLGCLLYFAVYLKHAYNDGILVLPYQTFFFHDMVEKLSDVL